MQSLTLEDVAYLLDMDGEGLCLHGLYTETKKINVWRTLNVLLILLWRGSLLKDLILEAFQLDVARTAPVKNLQ